MDSDKFEKTFNLQMFKISLKYFKSKNIHFGKNNVEFINFDGKNRNLN